MNKLVAQTLAKKENGEKGFTLIELLVVVIIIGILAAIAIPVFLNMREGAWRSSVESDVSNATLAIETAASRNNGNVPAAVAGTFAGDDSPFPNFGGSGSALTVSPDNTLVIEVADNVYTITGSNGNVGGGTTTFEYISDGSGAGWSE